MGSGGRQGMKVVDESAECRGCHKKFRFYRRRHCCHNCGLQYCSSCADCSFDPSAAAESQSTAGPESKRVCRPCFAELITAAAKAEGAAVPAAADAEESTSAAVVAQLQLSLPAVDEEAHELHSRFDPSWKDKQVAPDLVAPPSIAVLYERLYDTVVQHCGQYSSNHFTSHNVELSWGHHTDPGHPSHYPGAAEHLAAFEKASGHMLVDAATEHLFDASWLESDGSSVKKAVYMQYFLIRDSLHPLQPVVLESLIRDRGHLEYLAVGSPLRPTGGGWFSKAKKAGTQSQQQQPSQTANPGRERFETATWPQTEQQ